MNTILVMSILSIILTTSAFAAGFANGVKKTEIKVFKNCLSARIHPETCLQYMKILKDAR